MARKATHQDQFPAQFIDWANGEIEEARERLQYKSLRKLCREKLTARVSYLNQAIERITKPHA
jgi:hypothetical protein